MRRFQGVAALLFASAAGCGKTTSLTDAPLHDATGADSGTVTDATPAGDVTVITKSRCCNETPGSLDANVPVFTVQPDGNAGPMGQTDTNGKVVLTGVKEGASVTAVYTLDSTDFQIDTVVGVKPGDTITFGDSYTIGAPGGNAGTMTVTFAPFTGAANYIVYSSCASGSAVVSPITLSESCTMPTANLLVVALDASGTPLAAGMIKGAAYTDGATAALTAWTPAPAGGFATAISGLIADVDEVDFSVNLEVDGGPSYGNSGYIYPITGGGGTVSLPLPVGGDRTYVAARLYRATNQFGRQETYTSVGPTVGTASFPAPTLPWIGQILVDPSTASATWLQLGGTGYDAAFVDVNWNRDDIANDTTDYYNWDILLPPGQSTFQWSSPIAALAPYLPTATDGNLGGNLELIDLADAATYDQVRAQPEWQWNDPGYSTETGEITGVSSVSFPYNGGEGFAPAHHHGHATRPVSKRAHR